MTIHRFFVPPESMRGERFAMPTSVERQVRTVLRLGDGDRIVLLPGDGTEVACRIEGGTCVVEERRQAAAEPRHRLTIVQALLKGHAIASVVQHATEIGVAEVQLMVSERCVARDISARRLDRLRSIAREAAEQSERGAVPSIAAPLPFAELLFPGWVLLAERNGGRRLSQIVTPAAVVIGPEGGFSPGEVAGAERAGMVLAGLGPRILRSETVAVAAASVILSGTGDFA